MSTKGDIITIVEKNAKGIIAAIQGETRGNDPRDNGVLKQIQFECERILDTCATLRKYRQIKSHAIYIYDSRNDDFREADKTAKMKIARNLLLSQGLIEKQDT